MTLSHTSLQASSSDFSSHDASALHLCQKKITFNFVTQFPPSEVAKGNTSLKLIFILPLSLKTHCYEQSAAAWRIDLKRWVSWLVQNSALVREQQTIVTFASV